MSVFAAPQWTWLAGSGPAQYGYVHNAVNICPERGPEVVAYMQIPTEVFQLLPVIFSGAMEHVRSVGVDFYLDEQAGIWIMGVGARDGTQSVDLWSYDPGKLPSWARTALGRGTTQPGE